MVWDGAVKRVKGQEVWTFSFKVNKSWVCNVQCGDCSQWYTIYLVVAKKINIANPQKMWNKKKQIKATHCLGTI